MAETIEERLVRFFKQEKYRDIISRAVISGRKTIPVDFGDLLIFDKEFAEKIQSEPLTYLPILDNAAFRQLELEYPDYASKIGSFKTAVRGLPETIPIRKIRSEHLRKLIAVDGIVVRASTVRPLLESAAYRCRYCGNLYHVAGSKPPSRCKTPRCLERRPAFELVEEESVFADFQTLGVQEKPEDLPPGQIPRIIDVRVKGDSVDMAAPGDRVTVTGILELAAERLENSAQPRKTFLDAVSIEPRGKELESLLITPEEEKMFREMAADTQNYQRLIESVAPSIQGLEHIKEAILLLLFGGRSKVFPDGVRVRGDMHVLLVGDPGTAKSTLLLYAAQIAPRGVYTSGRGSTAAGLTAAVVRDQGGGLVLEAGASVLADMGICVIDEIDKMRPEDRVAMHEVMAQQSYHPSFELLTYDKGKMRIGELVDSLLNSNAADVCVVDKSEVLLKPPNIQVYTLDPANLRVSVCRPARVSRHKAPAHFIKITYNNGREIIVTPEHPVFVSSERHLLSTIRADHVKPGDYVPAPRILPNSSSQVLLREVASRPREKKVRLPLQLTPELARLLGYIAAEGHFHKGSSFEICFSNKDSRLLSDFRRLAEKLFCIIPNVHTDRRYGVVTLRLISTRLFRWFEKNFPELVADATHKRAPSKIMSASKDIVREFLRGVFAGDGEVSSSATLKTASRLFAEDCQDLLLKLGIHSSIHSSGNKYYRLRILSHSLSLFKDEILLFDSKQQKAAQLLQKSNTRRHHDILPPEVAKHIIRLMKLLGIRYRGEFYNNLRRRHGISRSVVRRCLDFMEEKLYRSKIVITQADTLRGVRSALGWSQQELAKHLSVSRSVVDYAERGGYDEEMRKRLLMEAVTKSNEVLRQVEGELQLLRNIVDSDLRWLRVKKVEKIRNAGPYRTEWVYDVTVEPTHSFISHGLLLHNTVSIAKGGIVATLNARCSILAAANPELGRYDVYRPFNENVNLPITLLSRFDLIFVLRDEPSPEADKTVSSHIVSLHVEGGIKKEPPIPPNILKKYIAYSKKIEPVLTQEAAEVLQQFYLSMRAVYEKTSTVSITARQLESLIRLAEARARACLRSVVTVDDAQVAVRLMRRSLSEVGIDVETGRPDIDVIMTGKPRSVREKLSLVLNVIRELQEQHGYADDEALKKELQEQGLSKSEIDRIINRMITEGRIYTPKPGAYRLA
ncbi:MAG: LAGLIDADG family homing endonuclease [Nitrososphaerota archaeon]